MERRVVLVGKADISVDHKVSDKSAAVLAADAVLAALDDAGIARRELDGADGVIAVPSLAVSAEFSSFMARHLDTTWRTSVAVTNGGSSPVDGVNLAARRIAAGCDDFLVVCGGENLNTLQRTQPHIHMASMQVLIASLYNKREVDAESAVIPASYAFYGAAHAARRGISLEDLKLAYGRMISDFSRVAAGYGPAKLRDVVTAEEVVSSEPVATPFTKLMCANPNLDQGAAVIVMSEERARALGVDEGRFIYYHGGGYCADHSSVEDERDFTMMRAAGVAVLEALSRAGVAAGELEGRVPVMDIYSCFPSVVNSVVEMLGMKFEDCARFTAAGGLARRGGSGSLYSFSGLCAVMERLAAGGGLGLVYGLGGSSSSHGACVLGREPRAGAAGVDSPELVRARREYADVPRVAVDPAPEGEAEVVTYSVVFANPLKSRGHEPYAVCIGRRDGRQFSARLTGVDARELAVMNPGDVIGRTCGIEAGKKGVVNMVLG